MEKETHRPAAIIPDRKKLESMGRMAGVIAHDINNMLGAIEGYATLLQRGRAEDDPVKQDTEEIRKAVAKAGALTKKLLSFSRRQAAAKARVDPNELVDKTPRETGSSVNITLRLQPDIPCILADAAQVRQLLLNLLSNARDAMPEGGEAVVSTALLTLPPRSVLSPAPDAAGARFVRLAVTDDGPGMPPEVIEHLFEPFFTTKEKGKGMGLPAVYGIARQHNGWVEVRSEPGKGSEFAVFLPALPDGGDI